MSELFRRQIDCDRLAALYEYWSAESADGRIMSRADIDPSKIYFGLPHAVILDIDRPSGRFRTRFAGTEVDGHDGQFLTDKYLDEVEIGGIARDAAEPLQHLVECGQPVYLSGEYKDAEGLARRFERVAMPLSSDGETVDAILAGVSYKSAELPELDELDMARYG